MEKIITFPLKELKDSKIRGSLCVNRALDRRAKYVLCPEKGLQISFNQTLNAREKTLSVVELRTENG